MEKILLFFFKIKIQLENTISSGKTIKENIHRDVEQFDFLLSEK